MSGRAPPTADRRRQPTAANADPTPAANGSQGQARPGLTATYAPKVTKMKTPNIAKPPHRPPFQFSAEQRAQAVRLRLAGCTLAQIAAGLGIAHKTLVKHMGAELEHATRDLLGHIAAKAYTMARAGDVRMVEFILRSRAGWVERCELADPASPRIMAARRARLR